MNPLTRINLICAALGVSLDGLVSSNRSKHVLRDVARSMKVQHVVPWRVYLLRCSNDALYCGVTVDMAARLKNHNAGKASKYTRSHLPVSVVCVTYPMSQSAALELEALIKELPSDRKLGVLQQIVDEEVLRECGGTSEETMS